MNVDGLKRGKWVAGRTVGLSHRVAPRERALDDGEWELLGEEVERCANQAVDEAIHAARVQLLEILDTFAAGLSYRNADGARFVREAHAHLGTLVHGQ